MNAAADGLGETAGLLVSKGAYVDPVDLDDQTPLHYAARGGHKEIVEFLLTKGADPEAANKWGWTAQMLAAKYGHDDLARRLAAAADERKPE